MGDIVNLNQFRKQKARTDKDARATVNCRKFGRTTGARKADDFAKSKQSKDLDGARLPPPPAPSDDPDNIA